MAAAPYLTDDERAAIARLWAEGRSSAEIAERLRRGVESVRRVLRRLPGYRLKAWRAWTADEECLLGTDTDRRVAKRLRRTVRAVEARRESLGIPSYSGSGPPLKDVEG